VKQASGDTQVDTLQEMREVAGKLLNGVASRAVFLCFYLFLLSLQ
jgi:hypothetical protein